MIVFPRSVYDELIEHAESGTPNEVCGVLGGEYSDDVSRIKVLERADNAADAPEYEYLIDPEEQYELMVRLEDAGHEPAGFYHSHPAGPPSPSETDAARATWPGLSYVIVVLGGEYPFVGSWRWNDDAARFEQEVVHLTR